MQWHSGLLEAVFRYHEDRRQTMTVVPWNMEKRCAEYWTFAEKYSGYVPPLGGILEKESIYSSETESL